MQEGEQLLLLKEEGQDPGRLAHEESKSGGDSEDYSPVSTSDSGNPPIMTTGQEDEKDQGIDYIKHLASLTYTLHGSMLHHVWCSSVSVSQDLHQNQQ